MKSELSGIIKLTERDLSRIVKRVMNEQDEKDSDSKGLKNQTDNTKTKYEKMKSDFLKKLTDEERKIYLELEKLSKQTN